MDKYNQRGAAEIEQFRTDKNGLHLSARRKQSLEAQKALVLLTDLCHNLLADFRQRGLAHSRFSGWGAKRIVRDLLAIPGWLYLVDGQVKGINNGLANSSYGIVILIPMFLSKTWPQKELSALVALEEAERGRILPVWHELSAEDLKRSLPMLADIVAVPSSAGLPSVVRELLRAINLPCSP